MRLVALLAALTLLAWPATASLYDDQPPPPFFADDLDQLTFSSEPWDERFFDVPMQPRVHTLVYKRFRGVDYHVDVYLPHEEEHRRRAADSGAPVLTFYHGGGMCAGARYLDAGMGTWLRDAVEAGFVVMTFDYTLASPFSAFQIINDVKDGLLFIRDELNDILAEKDTAVRVDPARVAVSGQSGGGCVAYYAAQHSPYPLKGLLAFYAEGGDFMLDWYLQKKKEPFLGGFPLIDDPTPYKHLRDADPDATPPTVESGDNARGMYYYWLLQAGQAVDVFTGVRGLSKTLRALPLKERDAAVPTEAAPAIPHLNISAAFPPSYLLHGVLDTVVHLAESQNMRKRLKKAGVEVKLWEVEGGEHGFDGVGWEQGPGGHDPELTRKRDEGLETIVPWLLEHV
ncbi:hypothetical protein JCM10207_002282 [Rhodosporidiobolus poonsookiae]